MTEARDRTSSSQASLLSRIVAVEPGETGAVLASFAMFFSLLAGYYVVRPLRDEMGIAYGNGSLHELFTVVFLVMLAAVPAFGIIASRLPRRLVLPAVYAIVVTLLAGFWLLFHVHGPQRWSSGAFFVFGSVFNLFVVSLFWALMAELWRTSEAKRLYGFISAGGTAGAIAGPLLTQALVTRFAPLDLLLVAAMCFAAALLASLHLRRLRPSNSGAEVEPVGGGMLDGASKTFSDPFFARIAFYILLANIVGTFFYLEQARLVAATLTESADRVAFFSSRDLIVSLATLTIELLGTAAVLRRFGPPVALLTLPVCAVVGTLSLTLSQTLWVVAAVMVAERVVAFSLANPATKVLYTTVEADEKYKVQSFIDTVVYRGGDTIAGWLFKSISGGAGYAAASLQALAIPLCLVWIWIGAGLGKAYDRRAGQPPSGA
jgi:AAA family ATP:ADP antiporter